MNDISKNRLCKNCGAVVETDVCPYCNAWTQSSDENINDMFYPVMKAKNVELKKLRLGFYALLIFIGLLYAISNAESFKETIEFFEMLVMVILEFDMRSILVMLGVWYVVYLFFFLPIVIIVCSSFGLGVFLIVMHIMRYLLVKKHGYEVEAIVCGYMNDKIYLNFNPLKIMRLLVNTNDGEKVLFHKLFDTRMLYKNNSKIMLKFYNNMYFIIKEEINYF